MFLEEDWIWALVLGGLEMSTSLLASAGTNIQQESDG
jgi:hypothetical protein